MGSDAGSLAIGLHPGLPDVDLVTAQRTERRIDHAMDDTLRSLGGPDVPTATG